jgi:hypothetical protein
MTQVPCDDLAAPGQVVLVRTRLPLPASPLDRRLVPPSTILPMLRRDPITSPMRPRSGPQLPCASHLVPPVPPAEYRAEKVMKCRYAVVLSLAAIACSIGGCQQQFDALIQNCVEDRIAKGGFDELPIRWKTEWVWIVWDGNVFTVQSLSRARESEDALTVERGELIERLRALLYSLDCSKSCVLWIQDDNPMRDDLKALAADMPGRVVVQETTYLRFTGSDGR